MWESPDGRVDEVLEIVDLADRADDRVRGYSYGMVQRLGLAAQSASPPAASDRG